MLMWLVWTGALAFAVIPVLIGAPLSFYAPLDLWLQTRLLWLAPAGAHVVFVWGKALLCQRPGYTTSLFHELSARFSSRSNRQQQPQGLKAALAAATRTGARAYCAADPAIDALFYPASNLVIDRSRWLCNAGLWVVVFALKVGFELFLVVYPLVSLMATVSLALTAAAVFRYSRNLHLLGVRSGPSWSFSTHNNKTQNDMHRPLRSTSDCC